MRWIGLLLLGFLAAPAHALPPFWETLRATYNVRADSPVGGAQCATCHTSPAGGARNAFGRQVQTALERNKTPTLTAAILKETEPLDADNDGITNGDELRAGTLPAVPEPSTVVPPTKAPEVPATFPPLHSYHPALVHFPIALFLFAAFLAFWRGGREMVAARLCAAGGAASLLVVLPTGLIAFLRQGYSLSGTMLIHLLLGVTTALLGLAAWRASGKSFRWLILAAGLMAALAGHWGALLVYPS